MDSLITSKTAWEEGFQYITKIYDRNCDFHGVIIHVRRKYIDKLKNKPRDYPVRFFYGDPDYLFLKVRAFENSHPHRKVAIVTSIQQETKIIDIPFEALELMVLPCLDLQKLKLRVTKELILDIETNNPRKIERLVISQAHKITRVPVALIDIDSRDRSLLDETRKILDPYSQMLAWMTTKNGYHLHFRVTEPLGRAIFRDKVLDPLNPDKEKPVVEVNFKPNHIYLIGTLKGGVVAKGEYLI